MSKQISTKHKPVLLAVFAHADDESFGPAGTIATYAKTHDIHIICVTKGDSPLNTHSGHIKDINKIRSEELLRSSKILGVKSVYFLDYPDGGINNNMYHDIASDVMVISDELQPEMFLTYEHHGVSGHIDHIAVSFITTYVFEWATYAKKILYYCISEESRSGIHDYFIHFPKGYHRDHVQQIVDVSDVWNQKVEAIQQHKSQWGDMNPRHCTTT
ncbi:MAG: PIG-L deacetylase family protein [Candidatus Roizmanbacteria bacterium]